MFTSLKSQIRILGIACRLFWHTTFCIRSSYNAKKFACRIKKGKIQVKMSCGSSNQNLEKYFHCVVEFSGFRNVSYMLEMPFDCDYDDFRSAIFSLRTNASRHTSGTILWCQWMPRSISDSCICINNEQDFRGFKHIGNNRVYIQQSLF